MQKSAARRKRSVRRTAASERGEGGRHGAYRPGAISHRSEQELELTPEGGHLGGEGEARQNDGREGGHEGAGAARLRTHVGDLGASKLRKVVQNAEKHAGRGRGHMLRARKGHAQERVERPE